MNTLIKDLSGVCAYLDGVTMTVATLEEYGNWIRQLFQEMFTF